jgi:arylsulfatase A-like enzyme
MDQGIGRILDALADTGLDEHTIVVSTSDNGPWLGGTGQDACQRDNGIFCGGKYDALEGGIRVPALARWPGVFPAGTIVTSLVHATDWLPTLLSLVGAPAVSTPLDGRDVSTVLRGDGMEEGTIRCWQWNRYEPVAHCNAAIRDGMWKLYWPPIPEAVHDKDPNDNAWYHQALTAQPPLMAIATTPYQRALSPPRLPRLYDLARDPSERTDLAADHPDRVRELQARWEAWFAEVDADRVRAQRANGLKPMPATMTSRRGGMG